LQEVYLGFFVAGIIFTLVIIVFGDLLDGVLDGTLNFFEHGFFKPVVLISGVTIFGGAGYLFVKYTSIPSKTIFILSLLIAIGTCILTYFTYVRPMKNAENSTAFSLNDLVGKKCTTLTTISENSYGEVMVKIGAGNTNQIAASLNKTKIGPNEEVVIAEVRENVLFVTKTN
jgi:membrane-bound ClpP family serine protease